MDPIYGERLQRVRQEMQAHGLDYVFLSISPDLFYLTGYTHFVSERLQLLMIPPEGRPIMIVPEFEKGMVAHLAGAFDLIGWQETEDPNKVVARLAGQSRLHIAFGDHTPAVFLLRIQAALPQAEFVPASVVMAPLRRVKDRVELALLKESQDLAVAALQRLLRRPLAGRTEREVAHQLRQECEAIGFEHVEAGLVASGPNGADPHLAATERVIQRGEPVVIDFGATHKGYYCDITRTVHVGPPSAEFQEIHEIVRQANHAALAAVRPGVPCEEIDLAARQLISAAGYGTYFSHRLGHGIGIEVHEEPYMVRGNKLLLEQGMTFTDEPGIYLPGKFGCRLEDVVAVTGEGGMTLTDYTHNLIVVE